MIDTSTERTPAPVQVDRARIDNRIQQNAGMLVADDKNFTALPIPAKQKFQDTLAQYYHDKSNGNAEREEQITYDTQRPSGLSYPGSESDGRPVNLTLNSRERDYVGAIENIVGHFTTKDGGFDRQAFEAHMTLETLALSNPDTPASKVTGFTNTLYLMQQAGIINLGTINTIYSDLRNSIAGMWSSNMQNTEGYEQVNAITRRVIKFANAHLGNDSTSLFTKTGVEHDILQYVAPRVLEINEQPANERSSLGNSLVATYAQPSGVTNRNILELLAGQGKDSKAQNLLSQRTQTSVASLGSRPDIDRTIEQHLLPIVRRLNQTKT